MLRFKIAIFILIQFFGLLIHGYSQNLPPDITQQIKSFSNPEKIKYLGDLCWSLREEKNHEAINCGRYAVALADSLEMFGPAAEISNYLGVNMLYYIYDTRQAWNYFRDALNYGIKSQDSLQIGYAYDNIGYMYLIHGDLSNAFEYEKMAGKIFTSLNSEQGMAYAFCNLGLVYQAGKEYDMAMDYFTRAKKLHIKNQNEIGIAAVLSCIGENYVLINQPDSAMVYFREQMRIAEKNGNKKYVAQALEGMSEVFYKRENYDEALKVLNQAMELSKERNDYFLLIDIRVDKALVLLKTGRVKEGEIELQESVMLAKKLRLPQSIYNISKGYSSFYSAIRYDEKAALIFQELFELYNSMYEDLQAETIKNENQKFQINQGLEQAKNEISINKTKEKLYYIIIFLMVLLAAILYWRHLTNKELLGKLQSKNIEIEQEIELKSRLFKALEKSEKKLKISNVTKDKFFSIIAHDLRSPFNAILGFSQLLSEEDYDLTLEKRKELAGLINETAQQTYQLLENLLIWSGSHTTFSNYQPETIYLKSIFEENLLLQQSVAEKKNITLKSTSNENRTVFSDKNMLYTILRNLISNAIKFTPDNGLISVTASENSETPDMISITVEDSGIGIPQEAVEQLFEITQVKSTRGTRNEKGTGLGLAICKEFSEILGGTIVVESQLGKGSKFIVNLPRIGPIEQN